MPRESPPHASYWNSLSENSKQEARKKSPAHRKRQAGFLVNRPKTTARG